MERPRNQFVWAWGSLLVLAMLGLMNKCVLAQFPPEVEYVKAQAEVVPWPWLSPTSFGMAAANTTCTLSNKPVILVDPRVIGAPLALWNEIISHENVHVRQFKAYKGGCQKMFADSQGAKGVRLFILSETEAYCSTSRDIIHFIPKLAKGLFIAYGEKYGMTEEEVLKLIQGKCYFWAGGNNASG